MEEILVWLRDLPEAVKAVIMGVVEGLTEFLPISSTGHLILAGWALGFDDDRAKVFDVAIQTGAVLAIVWLYRQRFLEAFGVGRQPNQARSPLLLHLLAAFLPAAVLGLLFGSFIKANLFAPVPVAAAFIVGGVIILWVEARQARAPQAIRVHSVDDMSLRDAVKIGLAQAFALIPGTSRSGATIIGGMLFGFSRQAATEFSFFLAVPTLIAAGAYSLLKAWGTLSIEDLPIFALGLVSAFLSALVVVKWLIRFVAHHRFTGFAWYRIVFGLVVLGTWQAGWLDWSTG
ncbi:BacA Undecaprenyl pyrophosphate phosphatase [Burkholderiales bacterium]